LYCWAPRHDVYCSQRLSSARISCAVRCKSRWHFGSIGALKSPFQIHAVYTTKFGLLVERDLSYMGASAEDQVSLYSLSHPLNELLAVIFKPASDSLTQWLFCWEKSEYRIIGAEDDFLLVFDRLNEVSLMRIRITSEHEVQSAIELMEKRRTEVTSAQGTPVVNPDSTPINAHRLQSEFR
uniref:CPSF_A domain-containing protein n=1 Tax=Heligmosomoides polygyrus TaxID=6339 RepID=A0A183GTI3_HELPZ